ncbi:MAG: T9SS type A sorting domain-containing protein [Melioribacteraceae bacterium]
MNKILHFLIFALIIFSSFTIAQTQPSMVRFDSPEYIPVDSEFDASVVFKLEEIPNRKVTFTFVKDKSVKILSAYLYIDGSSETISFKTSGNKISFSLNQKDFNFIQNHPYQILLTCEGNESTILKNKLFSKVEGDKNILPEFVEENHPRFYKSQEASGKALQFSNRSNLNLEVKHKNDWQNIYLEFWLKSNTILSNFLDIIDPIANDTLLSLSKNKLNFLSIPFTENEVLREDAFIGKGSWNYIGIKFSKSFGNTLAEVYVNSKLVYAMPIGSSNELYNLSYNFTTRNKNEKFEIDRFKLWDFNNNIKLANKNKHFTNFVADSSQVIYRFNFDSYNELNNTKELDDIYIDFENVKLKKSDAPIFSKAPKLTVTIGSAYNSIVWYVQEYSFAKEFVLEKAIGTNKYKTVYETMAYDDPLKIYNYADEVVNMNEVAYYRVRQINKDMSEVSSAEVKIGKKEAEEFRLEQNYPNPFNPRTNIYVDVIIPSEFEVNVYDLVGNKVEILHDGFLPQGLHTFPFDGSNLPSGIYFFEVISSNAQVVKKMILAK